VLAPVPLLARAGPDLTSVPVHAEALRAFPGIRPALHPAARAASFHDDAPAHAAAAALGVHAFTLESGIFFARGRLAPETPQGRALLEHELEHVQRGEGRGGRTMREAYEAGVTEMERPTRLRLPLAPRRGREAAESGAR
jgi:hypothetical protein